MPPLRRKTQLCCGGCSNCSELFLDISSWRCDLSPMGIFSCVAVISTSCFSVRLRESPKIGIWVFGSVCCQSTYSSFPYRDRAVCGFLWCVQNSEVICSSGGLQDTGWKPWHRTNMIPCSEAGWLGRTFSYWCKSFNFFCFRRWTRQFRAKDVAESCFLDISRNWGYQDILSYLDNKS